ncbi:MAG: UDP-N-acetylmuramate dehydrogenase [Terriglobales bacterium]
MTIQENVPLARLTTLKVGGPARHFADAASLDDARAALDFARSRELPLFVLGGGSNLVVADRGFPGLVLRVAVRGIEERRENGKMIFEAAAGEDWDGFVARTVERDCAGLECMSGIPGTVGGTPVQNVGAYGQEVRETIDAVRALDLNDGQVRELCNPACGFGYRTSIFNTSERGRYLVLGMSFALRPGGEPRLEYADLKKHFARHSGPPTLAETREAVRSIRLSKAMLIVEGDEDCRSAGSFFKNPVFKREEFDDLCSRAAGRGVQPPRFVAANGKVKVPAGWLVEQSGFPKGYTRGAVGISKRHALAIINRGGATAAEVVALKDEIQKRVAEEFGVALTPEPVFVGFEEN